MLLKPRGWIKSEASYPSVIHGVIPQNVCLAQTKHISEWDAMKKRSLVTPSVHCSFRRNKNI